MLAFVFINTDINYVGWVSPSHRAMAAMVASAPRPKNVQSKPRHNLVSNDTGSAKNLSIASYKQQFK